MRTTNLSLAPKITEPYGYILKPFQTRELSISIEMALYKHRMEKMLKESRKWLSTTLSCIGDGVIATDRNGLHYIHEQSCRGPSGKDEREITGKALEDVFHIIDEISREKVIDPVFEMMKKNLAVTPLEKCFCKGLTRMKNRSNAQLRL